MDRPLPSDAEIRRDPERGTLRSLRAENLSASLEGEPAFREYRAARDFAALALIFVEAHRSAFGLRDPATELTLTKLQSDDLRTTHVRFQQVYDGLPVVGAELIVHFREPPHVYLVNGSYVTTPDLDTTPGLSATAARQRAADELPALGGDCDECSSELVLFPASPSAKTSPTLAYRVRVSVRAGEGWEFLIDAHSGAVLRKIPTVYSTTGLRQK